MIKFDKGESSWSRNLNFVDENNLVVGFDYNHD